MSMGDFKNERGLETTAHSGKALLLAGARPACH